MPRNPEKLRVVFCHAEQLPVDVFEKLDVRPIALVRLPDYAEGDVNRVKRPRDCEIIPYEEVLVEMARTPTAGVQFYDQRRWENVVDRIIPDHSRR